MWTPNESALGHGFRDQEFTEELAEAFEDPGGHESELVQYTRYGDVWQGTDEPATAEDFDAAADIVTRIDSWADASRQASAVDADEDAVHGAEAAEWAVIGRRALRERMADD